MLGWFRKPERVVRKVMRTTPPFTVVRTRLGKIHVLERIELVGYESEAAYMLCGIVLLPNSFDDMEPDAIHSLKACRSCYRLYKEQSMRNVEFLVNAGEHNEHRTFTDNIPPPKWLDRILGARVRGERNFLPDWREVVKRAEEQTNGN